MTVEGYWVSSPRMTGLVSVDDSQYIMDTCPVWRCFIGQHFDDLIDWLERKFGFENVMNQPLKWHGGKHYLAKWIVGLMPPHVHYVEPYFGGGSVLLAKPYEGISEVANDVDGELMNFWRVLQSPRLFPRLVRMSEGTPFSQPQWNNSKKRYRNHTDLRRAWQFFVFMRQSRQGLGEDFATTSRNRTRRGMNEQVSSWLTAIEGLPEVHHRIKRVLILDNHAPSVIRSQDGPNTLFYLDPPYLPDTRAANGTFRFEMTEQDHRELLQTLEGIEGKFVLSGYRNPLYERYARRNKWRRKQKRIDNKASSKKRKETKTECVWMNY